MTPKELLCHMDTKHDNACDHIGRCVFFFHGNRYEVSENDLKLVQASCLEGIELFVDKTRKGQCFDGLWNTIVHYGKKVLS